MSAATKRCPLCFADLPRAAFDFWGGRQWACAPCYRGYVTYRRAFKAERGRYPTMAEIREDTE